MDLNVNLTLEHRDDLLHFRVCVNKLPGVEIVSEASANRFAWLNLKSSAINAKGLERKLREAGFKADVFDANEHEHLGGRHDRQMVME